MKRLLWGLPVIIILGNAGQNIFRSSVRIKKLQNEKYLKIQKKNKLQQLILSYDKKIEDLEDPYKREEIARNRLQMVLPGEKIYRLIDKK